MLVVSHDGWNRAKYCMPWQIIKLGAKSFSEHDMGTLFGIPRISLSLSSASFRDRETNVQARTGTIVDACPGMGWVVVHQGIHTTPCQT